MLNDHFTELKGEIGGPPDTPVFNQLTFSKITKIYNLT